MGPLWPAIYVYVGQAICYSHSQWADGRMKIFGFALQQLIRHAQTPWDDRRVTNDKGAALVTKAPRCRSARRRLRCSCTAL